MSDLYRTIRQKTTCLCIITIKDWNCFDDLSRHRIQNVIQTVGRTIKGKRAALLSKIIHIRQKDSQGLGENLSNLEVHFTLKTFWRRWDGVRQRRDNAGHVIVCRAYLFDLQADKFEQPACATWCKIIHVFMEKDIPIAPGQLPRTIWERQQCSPLGGQNSATNSCQKRNRIWNMLQAIEAKYQISGKLGRVSRKYRGTILIFG